MGKKGSRPVKQHYVPQCYWDSSPFGTGRKVISSRSLIARRISPSSPARSVSSCESPKLALQMPIYPEAEMPFFTRAGVENVSAAMSIRQASCSLYGASCRRASITRNRTSRP
jgi:hypothetical protein